MNRGHGSHLTALVDVAVGLTLRFPHAQIRYEPEYVAQILVATAAGAQSGAALR